MGIRQRSGICEIINKHLDPSHHPNGCLAWCQHEYTVDDIRRVPSGRYRCSAKYCISEIFQIQYLIVNLVRTTRSKIVRLQYDYKSLTDRIEAGLEVHFASGTSHGNLPSSSSLTEISSSLEAATTPDVVFAKVDTVSSSSPAEEAGLKSGDFIKIFGTVDNANNEKLRKVAEVVAQNEQVSIKIALEALRVNSNRGAYELLFPDSTQKQEKCMIFP